MTEKIGESGFQWLGAWYVADYKKAEEKGDQAETYLCPKNQAECALIKEATFSFDIKVVFYTPGGDPGTLVVTWATKSHDHPVSRDHRKTIFLHSYFFF